MLWGADASLATFAAAIALDLIYGELPNTVHPVVWMGKVTSWLEWLAPQSGTIRQLLVGALIALALPGAFAVATGLILSNVRAWPVLEFALGVVLLKSTFALRALGRAGAAVREALAKGEIFHARYALRNLCSRDASNLSEPLLVAATVESLAENASDSFVAPIFYFALFGIPGAIFYRAVNTLDAKIGYHGRYEYLGKSAARLDDVLNFIPARLTAGLLLLAGWLCRKDIRRGWLILARDGRKTESPNAGRPMAAMAGLLRIELEKSGHYRLGDPIEPLAVAKIDEAWRLVMLSAFIVAGLAASALGVRDACAR